ncbi:hypothetical protein U1Q18_009126 [Sarracenia purpurea var. burkii]
MGCCASTNFKATSASQKHRHFSASRSDVSLHPQAAQPPPSPPPPPEEETVKEVLSETPATKPPVPKSEDEERKGVSSSRPALNKIHEKEEKIVEKKMPLMLTEEVSEISEICSLSESVSTVTEKRENEDREVNQRVDRSPAKFRNLAFSSERNERAASGKSPARRFEPSPSRVRSVSGKERRTLATNGRRWDSGESSGRRSRSPATRGTEGGGPRAARGRSPSAGKTRKSPGRVRADPPEKTRKIEESKEIAESPAPTANESLENPLVSLECFIFL